MCACSPSCGSKMTACFYSVPLEIASVSDIVCIQLTQQGFAKRDRCASKTCWLSYNTALRAARLGYTEVYWYRGGIEAWLASGQVLAPLKVSWQRPPPE